MADMEAVSFAGCFGWLHQGGGGALGVALCGSWEYEALAIHQSWRVLADRLAEAGLPTLRFDYFGAGDSLGASQAPGALDAAVGSIKAAVAFLRQRAGVKCVALVGLRLGAALAMLAAEECEVEAAVLIRPFTRGRSYVSEQRALAKIISAREGAHVLRDTEPGAIEIEGFRLSAESVAKIAAIDLASRADKIPARVLIAGEGGSTQYDALSARLAAQGATIARLDLADASAWGPAPVPLPPPLADADAITRWLFVPGAAAPVKRAHAPGLQAETFSETAFEFGAGSALRGVLCCPNPPSSDERRRVVVFVNTGANCHVGSGRTFVDHARALAERGVASLRMDITGIGDSPWLAEGPLGAIHRIERVADVSAAFDGLKRLGFGEVCLIGVCSGAFLAFQTALADPRVTRLMLVNPSFWLPPSEGELADPLTGVFGSTSGYLSKLGAAAFWRRLFSGSFRFLNFRRIARELLVRLKRKLANGSASLAMRLVRKPQRAPLIAGLEKLAQRRCGVLLILSERDPAREKLAEEIPGGDFSALDGLMEIVEVKGADHAFATQGARREFRLLLEGFLDQRAAYAAERRKPRERAA